MRRIFTSYPAHWFVCFFFLVLYGTQQVNSEEFDFDVHQLLNDALLIHADISVTTLESHEILWSTEVNKITIPGRDVDISLEGNDARLEIQFIVYPADSTHTIIAAQSETWFGDHYNSALTSFPLKYGEEIHYYPLGRSAEEMKDKPVEIVVKFKVIPYLETLDDESRAELEASLDSSAQFRLTGD